MVLIVLDDPDVAIDYSRVVHGEQRFTHHRPIVAGDELRGILHVDAIRAAVPAALDATRVGGRVAVMSYQSLEDRLVKRVFADASSSTAPAGLPVELPEDVVRMAREAAQRNLR